MQPCLYAPAFWYGDKNVQEGHFRMQTFPHPPPPPPPTKPTSQADSQTSSRWPPLLIWPWMRYGYWIAQWINYSHGGSQPSSWLTFIYIARNPANDLLPQHSFVVSENTPKCVTIEEGVERQVKVFIKKLGFFLFISQQAVSAGIMQIQLWETSP